MELDEASGSFLERIEKSGIKQSDVIRLSTLAPATVQKIFKGEEVSRNSHAKMMAALAEYDRAKSQPGSGPHRRSSPAGVDSDRDPSVDDALHDLREVASSITLLARLCLDDPSALAKGDTSKFNFELETIAKAVETIGAAEAQLEAAKSSAS